MISKDILKQYPNAAERLYAFSARVLAELQKITPGMLPEGTEVETPDIPDNVKQMHAEFILEYSPRDLYDFFDQEEVYVNTSGRKSSWSQGIMGKDGEGAQSKSRYATRRLAEAAGFESAFQFLENKLK